MAQNTDDKVDINQSVFSFVSFLPSQYIEQPFFSISHFSGDERERDMSGPTC